MSNTVRLLSISPLQTEIPLYFPSNRILFSTCVSSRFVSSFSICTKNVDEGRLKALANYSEEGSIRGVDSSFSSPVSIELKPVLNETQFDRVIAEPQQLEESVVFLWMASWCRKCIYLKPKLEKLAAEYHPSIRFYCIDVNNVPHELVVRAGVTKMPTIQLWKDGKKQAEVIGGHKAYLVVNEVRENNVIFVTSFSASNLLLRYV